MSRIIIKISNNNIQVYSTDKYISCSIIQDTLDKGIISHNELFEKEIKQEKMSKIYEGY